MEGLAEDLFALVGEWGISLGEIAAPLRFWHGDGDAIAPCRLTRRLVDAIPGASLTVVEEAGHFGTLRFLPEARRFLASGVAAPSRRASGPGQ